MKYVVDLVKQLGVKMSGLQVFILMLIITIGVVTIQSLNYIKSSKYADQQYDVTVQILTQMKRMNSNIEKSNLNIVDYNTAVNIYKDTFNSSMADITRMAMMTLSHNHVDNANRQTYIKRTYTRDIITIYNEDVVKLNKIRYENKKLGGALEGIDHNEVVQQILRIMFREGTLLEKRKDIESYLHSNVNVFTQVGKDYLSG